MTSPPNFRDHRTYLVHLLRVLHGRGAVTPSSIYDEVAAQAGVTEEQKQVGSPKVRGNPAVYRNRIQFARQALVDAELMIGSSDPGWKYGRWELSEGGAALAAGSANDVALDRELRERAAQGAKQRAIARKESRALAGLDTEGEQDAALRTESDADSDDDDTAPSITALVEAENAAAMSTMLDHVRTMSETLFEHLVGDVLKAALRADKVTITQQSRDGGIDGVLHFDALGMRIGVFEAKRYGEGTTVGRTQIDSFATAVRRRRAAHSLFVTSNRFSHEAIQAARGEGIRLIDGVAFVELMAAHSIGLRARERFVVYEIDPAWGVDDSDTPTKPTPPKR